MEAQLPIVAVAMQNARRRANSNRVQAHRNRQRQANNSVQHPMINKAHQFFNQLPDIVCSRCHSTLYSNEAKTTAQGATLCKICPVAEDIDLQQYTVTEIPTVIKVLNSYEEKFLSPIRLFSTINSASEVLANRRGYDH